MNTSIKADLHCHSLFSDGALSPDELVKRAVKAQVDLLALTDHDSIAGVALLLEAAHHQPIQIVTGIELSVRWKLIDIHIVGLHVDIHHPGLTALIDRQNEQRVARAKQMVEQLQLLGIKDLYQKACEVAGHERIGRPHIGQVLVNEGVVDSITTAFKRYLARGRPGYVATSWLNIHEAVSGILSSGGQAVIAHPLKYKLTRSKLRVLIDEFKAAGGVGIEVISGEMTVTQISEMAGLCARFELYGSTGSDFHNDNYSRIKLGQQASFPLNCKPIWEKWNI